MVENGALIQPVACFIKHHIDNQWWVQFGTRFRMLSNNLLDGSCKRTMKLYWRRRLDRNIIQNRGEKKLLYKKLGSHQVGPSQEVDGGHCRRQIYRESNNKSGKEARTNECRESSWESTSPRTCYWKKYLEGSSESHCEWSRNDAEEQFWATPSGTRSKSDDDE